jgi:membrane-associated phospholipid phosphatase
LPKALYTMSIPPNQPIRHPGSFVALVRGQAVLAAIALLSVLFFFLTWIVLADHLQPTSWDKTATHEIQELPASTLGQLLIAISWPGFALQSWIIPGLVVLFMFLRRWYTEAVFTLLASLGGMLAEIVKYLVHRPRPTPDLAQIVAVLNSPSFPSGHVTSYAALYGFLFYLAYTLLPRRSLIRWVILLITAALILLVGPSRVYMGQHWASDALAGYALGFTYLLIVIELYRAWMRRHPQKRDA